MEKLSKTQKKKAAQALQKLGERLVKVSEAQFDALVLPEELLEAVSLARKIKSHEARRRQLQFIGRLMREYDSEMIEKALQAVTEGESQDKRKFKMAERWREELLNGNNERQVWLLENYPAIDPGELERLVRQAKTGLPGASTKKAARMLFRYLFKVLG